MPGDGLVVGLPHYIPPLGNTIHNHEDTNEDCQIEECHYMWHWVYHIPCWRFPNNSSTFNHIFHSIKLSSYWGSSIYGNPHMTYVFELENHHL